MPNKQTVRNDDNVWIELPKPRDVEHAKAVVVKANRMLARLNGGTEPRDVFFVTERHPSPGYCYGSQMGYKELVDRGSWFNLDYLGREEPAVKVSDLHKSDHPEAQANRASWPTGPKRRKPKVAA